jgi:hypothetical protein
LGLVRVRVRARVRVRDAVLVDHSTLEAGEA